MCDTRRTCPIHVYTHKHSHRLTLNSKVERIQNKRRSKCDSRKRAEANANVTNIYRHTDQANIPTTGQLHAILLACFYSIHTQNKLQDKFFFFFFFFVRSFARSIGFICQYKHRHKKIHSSLSPYTQYAYIIIYILCFDFNFFLLFSFILARKIFFLCVWRYCCNSSSSECKFLGENWHFGW